MPEGDTIFRAARTLQRALAGKVVTRFETQYAQIARVHDDAPITGRVVEKVEARGKHLLMYFSASGIGNRQPAPGIRDCADDRREDRVGALEAGSRVDGARAADAHADVWLVAHLPDR